MGNTAPFTSRALAGGGRLLRQAAKTSYDLFKITVPVSIVIRVLMVLGVVDYLGAALGPVMRLVGLPGSMGLVWATAIVANIYGGMVAFAAIAPGADLTVAQATVLCTMMLVAHGLLTELRIAQKSGPRLRAMAVLRLAGAVAIGWLLNRAYTLGGFLQGPNALAWNPRPPDDSWAAWAVSQIKTLAVIFVIILVLLLALRLLDRVGVTGLLVRLLGPVLRVLGISKAAAPVTIIGMTMGMTYGGGLIIQEAKSGRLAKRDIFFSLALMGLCHSLIEDTLLMVALGAHTSGVLWARMAFALAVVFLLVRVLGRVPDRVFDRFLSRAQAAERQGAGR